MNAGWNKRRQKLIGALLGVAITLTTSEAIATSFDQSIVMSAPVVSIGAERSEIAVASRMMPPSVAATLDTITDVGFTVSDNVQPAQAVAVEPDDRLIGEALIRHGTLSYSGGGLFNYPGDSVPERDHFSFSDNSPFLNTAVPEPATLWLLCPAVLGVALAWANRMARSQARAPAVSRIKTNYRTRP